MDPQAVTAARPRRRRRAPAAARRACAPPCTARPRTCSPRAGRRRRRSPRSPRARASTRRRVYRRWGTAAELQAAVAVGRLTGDIVVPDTGIAARRPDALGARRDDRPRRPRHAAHAAHGARRDARRMSALRLRRPIATPGSRRCWQEERARGQEPRRPSACSRRCSGRCTSARCSTGRRCRGACRGARRPALALVPQAG